MARIDEFSDGLLTDLAGNAYPLPAVMSIVLALLACVPWCNAKKEDPQITVDEEDASSDDDSHPVDVADAAAHAVQALRQCCREPARKTAKRAH